MMLIYASNIYYKNYSVVKYSHFTCLETITRTETYMLFKWNIQEKQYLFITDAFFNIYNSRKAEILKDITLTAVINYILFQV